MAKFESMAIAKQIYYYVISDCNKGWGVVVPEILGILKHAKRKRYKLVLITKPGNHTETIKLFEIGKDLIVYNTDKLYEDCGLANQKRLLEARISDSNLFYENQDHFGDLRFEMNVPEYSWPFGDLLRCIVHSTELVHPDFHLGRCNFSLFEQITVEGMKGDIEPLSLRDSVRMKGENHFRNKLLPFVVSVREGPETHGGINRNTTPEGLDMLLEEVKEVTDEIELIGTMPKKKLREVLRSHNINLKINDYTYKEYESINLNKGVSMSENHILQTYLLATKSVKLLCENGIVAIPQAAGQVQGLFDADNMFQPYLDKAIVVPKGYGSNGKLSASKALIMNMISCENHNWIENRVPMKAPVVKGAIQNLMKLTLNYSQEEVESVSRYKPNLLRVIREEMINNPTIKDRLGYEVFGSHLIQDEEDKAIRFC